MRVLTWNLFHGRSRPPAGRSLRAEFAAALAGWRWDVALLQEVPPWWAPELAAAAGAMERSVLTSRNLGLRARRWVADRRPDLIRSNGGGANAILVRSGRVLEHRALRLRRLPERRWVHAVALDSGVWVANLHATVPRRDRAQRDLGRAVGAVLVWARGAPVVLGGDVNQRRPRLAGMREAGSHHVDGVWVRGLDPRGSEPLDAGSLSDHRPLAVELGGVG